VRRLAARCEVDEVVMISHNLRDVDCLGQNGRLAPTPRAYFFLGTRIGLTSSLSMGATRSWIAASSAEAKWI
jgi:hypothetical protein